MIAETHELLGIFLTDSVSGAQTAISAVRQRAEFGIYGIGSLDMWASLLRIGALADILSGGHYIPPVLLQGNSRLVVIHVPMAISHAW
jgi:hypothetical protein